MLNVTKSEHNSKHNLQLPKTLQSANWQCSNWTFFTAHFDFTTAQIVFNCTLKYALYKIIATSMNSKNYRVWHKK